MKNLIEVPDSSTISGIIFQDDLQLAVGGTVEVAGIDGSFCVEKVWHEDEVFTIDMDGETIVKKYTDVIGYNDEIVVDF